ncbi:MULTISPECIES: hypothetical protein [Streptomyces]|uniref:DUF8094 domain-containing protein n=1 Tax=Streptomyces dengpaensis TaxID=2049881 RepID=A0ABM6SWT2_9ACTN|nr:MULTISPECIES: hypothetical protein [Streptomyces]AVH59094.1 hypothetical protein C4B68_28875 [Streptomyces dengpaensis]PIB08587.1 hypothetical protein B1C81_13480 [Streptomyces sp. HG99]
MSRDRSLRRLRTLRGIDRIALAAASVTALSLTASGCVVVHGEREVVPTATRAEAARALKDFTTAYNQADKEYDRSLDADRVTGPLADIDGAKLKAGRKNHPEGNPAHAPLKFTDSKFVIPAKAAWPRWFVADTAANKGLATSRWLLVFTRASANDVWQVSYLTVLSADEVPAFKTDDEGWAEPVTPDDAALAIEPEKLSQSYTTYLKAGGDAFATGAHTSQWRDQRKKFASKPGLARQYIDEPLTSGDYAPVGLRTTDGGALVFFTTHRYEKQTAAAGAEIPTPSPEVQALTTGEIKQSLTLEFISNQAALDPAKGAQDGVSILGRIEGLTGAKGE